MRWKWNITDLEYESAVIWFGTALSTGESSNFWRHFLWTVIREAKLSHGNRGPQLWNKRGACKNGRCVVIDKLRDEDLEKGKGTE